MQARLNQSKTQYQEKIANIRILKDQLLEGESQKDSLRSQVNSRFCSGERAVQLTKHLASIKIQIQEVEDWVENLRENLRKVIIIN